MRRGITPEAVVMLCCYQFPGNVRELSNLAERLVVSATSDLIDVADLPAHVRGVPAVPAPAVPGPGAGPPQGAAEDGARAAEGRAGPLQDTGPRRAVPGGDAVHGGAQGQAVRADERRARRPVGWDEL